jgi:phage gp46-like protein
MSYGLTFGLSWGGDDQPAEAGPTVVVLEKRTPEHDPAGTFWTIGSTAYVTAKGELVRERGIATRCYFRLKCRRGQYIYDPDLGSRIHTLRSLAEGRRKAATYIREALQPLLDEGALTAIDIGELQQDSLTGLLVIPIELTAPPEGIVPFMQELA